MTCGAACGGASCAVAGVPSTAGSGARPSKPLSPEEVAEKKLKAEVKAAKKKARRAARKAKAKQLLLKAKYKAATVLVGRF